MLDRSFRALFLQMHSIILERVAGIEPASSAWKAEVKGIIRYPRICTLLLNLVRIERLELSYLSVPEPKSGASTNFATSAVHNSN